MTTNSSIRTEFRAARHPFLAATLFALPLTAFGCSGNPSGSFDFRGTRLDDADAGSTDQAASAAPASSVGDSPGDAGEATSAPSSESSTPSTGRGSVFVPDGGASDADSSSTDATADAPGTDAGPLGTAADASPEAASVQCAVTFTVNGATFDQASYTGVFVFGNVTALGGGSVTNAVPMAPVIMGTYTATVTLDDGAQVVFKFLERGAQASSIESWSPDLPRSLTVSCSHPGIALVPIFTGPVDAGTSPAAQGTTYVGTFGVRPEDAQ